MPSPDVYGFLPPPTPTPPRNSVASAGGPTAQLNYDTIYPEIASDSIGLGLSPTSLLPPTSCKSKDLTIPSSGSITLLSGSQNPGQVYLPDHWFRIKGCNSGTAGRRTRLGQCVRKQRGASKEVPTLSSPGWLHRQPHLTNLGFPKGTSLTFKKTP